jgi:hypothetical protein
MFSRPLTFRHHPNFIRTDPSGSTKSFLATITPCGHRPPTHSFPLPYELPQPKNASDTPGGPADRGSVTGQPWASAIVTGAGL